MKPIRIVLIGLLFQAQLAVASDPIYRKDFRGDFAVVYQEIYRSLEEARFFVIFEADIGRNLAKNAERWGEDYNRNGFEGVRSMIICSPWYANQLLNIDPRMMALCPMNITLLYRAGTVTALFERLTVVAEDSPAAGVLWEIENTVIGVIEDVAASHADGADPAPD